jgi:hypothetical protein
VVREHRTRSQEKNSGGRENCQVRISHLSTLVERRDQSSHKGTFLRRLDSLRTDRQAKINSAIDLLTTEFSIRHPLDFVRERPDHCLS